MQRIAFASALLCMLLARPASALDYDLMVTTSDAGYGTVASNPGGIDCYVPVPGVYYFVAPDCAEKYGSGTSVTLTATPNAGSVFSEWSGACTGTGTCTVIMSAARSVNARFSPIPVADTQAPTVPSGLAAIAVSSTQINVGWNAATDNVGVTAYKVYRAATSALSISPPPPVVWTLIATLGTGRIYSDVGLAASTAYSYTVSACDAKGNCSAPSAAVSASTPAISTAPVVGNPTQRVALPPVSQIAYTAPSGQLPTAAVSVSPSGTLGNAALAVTLDLSRMLSGGSFARSGEFAAGSNTYNIYVVALAPKGALGLPAASLFVLSETHAWSPLGSPIAAYRQGLAQNATDSVVISILSNLDVTGLVGTEIYIGYGISDTEMLAEKRYRGVYKVQ